MKGNIKIPDLSICVPVYNMASYLADCIDSIVAQNFGMYSVEFLFVDDCSTDGSSDILFEYKKQYSDINIRIITHDKNRGLWASRNTLMDNAHGRYIMNCDADDMYSPGLVIHAMQVAIANHSDVVVFPIREFDSRNKRASRTIDDKRLSWDLNRLPLDVYHFSLCNKLIRRSLIEDYNLRVPDGVNCWEDLSITARVFSLANSVVTLHEYPYLYRKHTQSYTARSHKHILEQHLACADFLIQWFAIHNLSARYSRFISTLKFVAKIKFLRGGNFQFREWLKMYPESNAHIFGMPGIGIFYKIGFKILQIGGKLYM